MIRALCLIIFMYCCLINNAIALPWFRPTNPPTPASFVAIKSNNQLNYSGNWIGECNNSQAVELNIIHRQDKFSISYGFMTESYVIGEVKSTSLSHASGSEHLQTTLQWSSDQTALIFINSNLFSNQSDKLNSFFSKVTMVLHDVELIVNGEYLYTNNTISPIQKEIIFCTYYRKN